MSFDELCLEPRFQKALKAQNITTPTPVQEQAIPVVLDGKDVVVTAQTGTGKTLAFALPVMTHLAKAQKANNRVLVLTPTRELAQQVHDVCRLYGKAIGIHTVCLYGGAAMGPQISALRRGCDIIVATPGRLLDHMNRGNVNFKKLTHLIMDEADRMLDMGFLPDIRRILSNLPKDRQTLMFSATFPKEIQRMTTEMQRDPQRIAVGVVAKPAETVRQGVYAVESTRKLELLSQILKKPQVESTIVFMRTKHRTDRVAKALHKAGFKAKAIHGGRTQAQRQQAIDGFRNGKFRVLVATDVAARGLDVDGITHVVNYDIPNDTDTYVHRIGRTARANAEGDAYTFVSPNEFMELGAIEKSLGKSLPREEWEGSVPVISCFDLRQKTETKGRAKPRRRSLLRRR